MAFTLIVKDQVKWPNRHNRMCIKEKQKSQLAMKEIASKIQVRTSCSAPSTAQVGRKCQGTHYARNSSTNGRLQK